MNNKFCILLTVGLLGQFSMSIQPASAQGSVVPEAEQARAIFKKRCASCHSQVASAGWLGQDQPGRHTRRFELRRRGSTWQT